MTDCATLDNARKTNPDKCAKTALRQTAILGTLAPLFLHLPPMKLDHYPFTALSDQDRIDLGKIWPSQDLSTLTLDENHRLYAAPL